MKIRRMIKGDLDRVYEIGSVCTAFTVSDTGECFWPKAALLRWCQSRQDLMLIAKEGDELIGFAFFACHRPTGKVILENLWVHPTWRRCKIATCLLDEAWRRLQRRQFLIVTALVNTRNTASRHAFQSLGLKSGFSFLWMDRSL